MLTSVLRLLTLRELRTLRVVIYKGAELTQHSNTAYLNNGKTNKQTNIQQL